jgi:predicted nucleotidyltransferase
MIRSEPAKIPSIEEIRERLIPLFEEEGLQLILVFGSVVTGTTHEKSDIDLAFLFDRPVDIVSLTNRVIRLLHTDHVDVIDLKHASPLLKFSAVDKGRLIYEKSPGLFNEFCSLAFRMYVDTKKLRDARARTIKYFLETRGLA